MIALSRRVAVASALTIAGLSSAATLTGVTVARSTDAVIMAESQGSAHEVLLSSNRGWLAVGFEGWRPYVIGQRVPSPAGLPECVSEDSVSCVWHAERHGNGVGRSFTTDANGEPHFFGPDNTADCVLTEPDHTTWTCTAADGQAFTVPAK